MPEETDASLDDNVEFGELQLDDPESVRIQFYGGRWLSAFPLTFFIFWAIFQSGILRIGDTEGLVLGMLLGLILGMFFVKGSWKSYASTIFEGMSQPVAASAIIAWLWAGMFADVLQTGNFVQGLVWLAHSTDVGFELFPALTFILSALLATGIGTGYGTTIAFTTLFFPAGVLLGADPTLLFGSILAGAVFGDNLAPVSDTTIVSAITQDSDIGGVVKNRFKYAILAAIASIILYVFVGFSTQGVDIAGEAKSIFLRDSNPYGLIHLISMGIVIFAAVRGRHIVEAISWGLVSAVAFNLAFGLASIGDLLLFKVESGTSFGHYFSFLPFVKVVSTGNAGVEGSLLAGAVGFFPLIVLVLLIVSGAQIMIRGGGFEALQNWLLRKVIGTVQGAEFTMILSTALINAMITINTAAEIAIAPYISKIGKKFNLNGYRRANILDANTSALGYIFPWSGGVLVGYAEITALTQKYDWFTQSMVVHPADVWPYVFHGWFLVLVFLLAAWTGFGREYSTDRTTETVQRV